MGAIYRLTLRQLSGRGRLLLMAALAAIPVLAAHLALRVAGAPAGGTVEDVVLGQLLVGAISPLVALATAAASFGNEVEDATLANLTLAPLPRWKIVVPKLLAPLTLAGALVGASALATGRVAFPGDARAVLAVTSGALVGVALYASVFLWLGLVSSRAVGIGLAYVVLWEGLFTGFVSGARLLSVRYHSLSLAHGLDPRRFAETELPGLSVSIAVSAAVLGGFLWLTVRRLRTMDVP